MRAHAVIPRRRSAEESAFTQQKQREIFRRFVSRRITRDAKSAPGNDGVKKSQTKIHHAFRHCHDIFGIF